MTTLAKVPHLTVPSPTNALPQSGQSWGAYWTTVTAMSVLMFLIYIAANGQLAAWIALFTFSTPDVVAPPVTGGVIGGVISAANAIGNQLNMINNAFSGPNAPTPATSMALTTPGLGN